MSLFVEPRQSPTSGGNNYAGAKYYFYLTGTTTPAAIYTDAARTTQHANPVIADSGGVFEPIWLDPTTMYRRVLKNSAGATLSDVDPYPGAGVSQDELGRVLFPISDAEQAAGVTPTYYYYEYGDVRRFGAVGDGVTDDRTAIQNAINVAAEDGGAVYFPETMAGIYLVSSSGSIIPGGPAGNYCLLIQDQMILCCDSKQAVKSSTEAATVFAAIGASDGSHVNNVVFDGINVIGKNTTDNGVGRGIYLYRADNCVVRNCDVSVCIIGIQADRNTADSNYNVGNSIINNRVHDTYGTVVGNGSGIFTALSKKFIISGNRCSDTAEHCIYVGLGTNDGEITNNILSPVGSANQQCGVQIYSSAASPDISGLVISNNVVIGGKWGILLSTVSSQILKCVISGNKVSGQTTNGILTSNTRECSISSNVVHGITAGAGIECDVGRSMSVIGNTSSANGTSGIMLYATTDSVVIGNHSFDNDQTNATNYGIRVAAVSTGNKIIGNICTNYAGATQKYGIQIDADSTGCEVAFNTTAGNATGEILDQVSATPLSSRTLIRSRSTATYQEVVGPAGQDIQVGRALVALGGGAAPTLGTIGGSGPATAGQNTWMRFIDSAGVACWVPVWK